MNRVVLDACALLAILNQEAGAEKLTPELLGGAICSTVRLAEVQGKLVAEGIAAGEAWEAAMSLVREVVSFTSEQAKNALAGIVPGRSSLLDARIIVGRPRLYG